MTGSGWRFALSRRWLGYAAAVIAFAVLCTFLALWQISRREEARQEIARVESNWDSSPVPIGTALPDLEVFDPDDKWLTIELTGRYLSAEQLLVRGRPANGAVGFEVLVPFLLDDGRVFIVDRGWVPAGNQQDEPDAVPAPPAGEVVVTARLKPGEPTIIGRSAPEGQIATIYLPEIAKGVGLPTYTGAYGLLAEEVPGTRKRPQSAAKPIADEGPHLSYAFQWFLFGVMGFVALIWAIRQEHRIRNADTSESGPVSKRRVAAKRPSDAEIEDELLDG